MTWPTTKLSKTGMVIEEETSEHEEAIRLRLLPCLPRGKAWQVCKAMRLFPSRATLSDLGTNAAMLLLMWTACKHIQFFCCLQQPPLSPNLVACMGVLKMHRVRECIFVEGEPKQLQNHGAAPAEGSCVALPGVSARGNAADLKMPSRLQYLHIPRKKQSGTWRGILEMLWKEFRADDSEDLAWSLKKPHRFCRILSPSHPCKSSQRQVDALADVALAYIWVLSVWTTRSRRRQTWWTMDAYYECLRLDLPGLRLQKKRDQWDWWYFSIWIKKLIDIDISKLE